MGYVTPADVPVSSTWNSHKNRNPPSSEPGTDYATAYGTDCRMPGNGVIAVVDNNNGGGEGRRLQMNMDNGEVIDYIHAEWIFGYVGQRIQRGQRGIFISGASGNGKDWYYGPHVHVTRRATKGLSYKQSIDFELAVGNDNGGFLMGLSDAQQNEIYNNVKDTQTRVRGTDPNVDMLQDIQLNAKSTYVRVRGEDPNVDMLQNILGQVSDISKAISTQTAALFAGGAAILVLAISVVWSILF